MTKEIVVPITRHPYLTKVVPGSPEVVAGFILSKGMDWEGEMVLRDKKVKRSRGREGEEGNQDGAFFGPIMKVLMEEIWQTKNKDEAYIRTLEEVSYVMERNPKGGHPLKRLIHVSDMDMGQMARLIDDVLQWAAQEHGVYLESPDPKKAKRWKERFKREYQQKEQ